MSRFWSSLTHDLKPYVPGEQPRMADLVKLNTNESPFGPSPRALEAIRGEATDALRLYPDPQATALRAALATYHQVRPEQVFVGNGSDEVLAHAFAALLKHDAPLLFPDFTYSFYPVYCRLFGIAHEPCRSIRPCRSAVPTIAGRPALIVPNPNAPTALRVTGRDRYPAGATSGRACHDEALCRFRRRDAIPLVAPPNLLVIQTMSKSGPSGFGWRDRRLRPDRGAHPGQDSFNSYRLAGPPGRRHRL
jgi:histidinol-phosphate aminotransferase